MVAGLVGTAGLLVNVNCGSGGGGGTGGTTGTGGSATGGKGGTGTGGTGTGGNGTGGTSSTGGKGGTTATGGNGGTSATGGNGGTSATGGNGGASATGGSGGKGTGGSGGNSNTDGGTQQYAAFSYTFDKDVQGWALNTGNTSAGNLSNVDGGVKPVLTWDSSTGSPGTTPNGSLKIDATYSDYSQFAQVAVNPKPAINATGRSVSVYVMLDAEDGGATWPGNVQVSASSGASYNGYTQVIKSMTAGQWMQVTLPLTASSSFDPTQLVQIGVQFVTYSRPEGGSFGAPQHRTFHVDTVTDGSGLPPAPPLYVTFDSSLNGLSLSDSSFKFPDGGTGPALTFDSTAGDPANGSAKLVIPFNSYNQQLDTQINLSPTVDLTGKTLHAKVRLDSGTFTAGYINLHVSAPDYSHYAQASTGSISASGLTAGQWVDLSIVLSSITSPSGFDPSKVLQVGVQFGTSGGPEGGAFPTSTQPVTFHIDSIVAQ
jgi:hypothetical protein